MSKTALTRTRDLNLLAFQLKLAGSSIRKRVFVSTGRLSEKERLLPAIQALAEHNVEIYATEGTNAFLTEKGVRTRRVAKINEGTGENAETLLREGTFDLVVNILTGEVDYDERSDARIIRQYAIENHIPLITDTEVALATIRQLVSEIATAPAGSESWNMRDYFARLILDRGGYANYHAHADKAYLMTPQYLELGEIDMQAKWDLYRRLKQGADYTFEGLYRRIERVVQTQIAQGVTHFRTLIDADTSVGTRAVEAALAVKQAYADHLVVEIGTQPLEGVLNPDARRWFEEASAMADLVGGLPSKDRPRPEGHLDVLMQLAKSLGKRLDVHVDQENNPNEDETELLALKTIEHGMEGQVSAIHSISLAAKPEHTQDEVIRKMKDAGLSVIVCPSAAISMRQLPYQTQLHNSIAPVMRLLEADIQVVLGTDNISDFFMPFVDGDMWTEIRFLMEAVRCYNAPLIADLATDKSLFAVS